MTDKILQTHAAKRIRDLLIQIGDLEVLCAEQQDEINEYEKEAVETSGLISDYQYLQARNETLEKENTNLAEQVGSLGRKVDFLTTRNDSLATDYHKLSCDNQSAAKTILGLDKIIKAQGEVHQEHILKMVIFLSKNDLRFSDEIIDFLDEGKTVQAIKHLRSEMQRCYGFDPSLKVCFDAIHAHPSYHEPLLRSSEDLQPSEED